MTLAQRKAQMLTKKHNGTSIYRPIVQLYAEIEYLHNVLQIALIDLQKWTKAHFVGCGCPTCAATIPALTAALAPTKKPAKKKHARR